VSAGGAEASSGSEDFVDDEDPEPIKAAKRAKVEPDEYKFTERDVILYNLGIGATVKELKWTYENADGFCVSFFAAFSR
jgi:multifunctional beta-oxidation protein